MKTLVVGGTFNNDKGKASKIIKTIAYGLNAAVVNGGTLEDLKVAANEVEQNDLIIWMPNVDNQEEKTYFKKHKGAVLIISKRIDIGSNRSEIDAVSRIFKFGGNAVITIKNRMDITGKDPSYYFKLIDALGNVWVDETKDIKDVVIGIYRLNAWTKKSIRKSLTNSIQMDSFESLQKLININKQVAEKCQKAFSERFFGNLSTRCVSMFPSMRNDNCFLFSARNTDKEFLTIADMIFVNKWAEYSGSKKPSVDTPVQLYLYRKWPNINYMIHGHAYIEGAPFTEEYFPCGDLRETDGIIKVSTKTNSAVINLKNHGFLITATSLVALEDIVNRAVFKTKGIETL